MSIDNATLTLQKIQVADATTTDICTLTGIAGAKTLTFSRGNVLYAGGLNERLYSIDPCTCVATDIGAFGFVGVAGITATPQLDLFGISSGSDVLLRVDTATGAGSIIGALGVDFGNQGAAWNEMESRIYALNANTDDVYGVDATTGAASLITSLDQDFGSVGFEYHPLNQRTYGCSSDAILYEIDTSTGMTSGIGPIPQPNGCSNLAAPWIPVSCL